MIVGGMPEVVKEYCDLEDVDKAREVQQQLLEDYKNDFAKHSPNKNQTRLINDLWTSIPRHLARERGKFIWKNITNGAQARRYSIALNWLKDMGLIHQVYRTNNTEPPLSQHHDDNAFKVYLVDVGLLGALSNINPLSLLDSTNSMPEYKGMVTEQFVLQEMLAYATKPNSRIPSYWSRAANHGTAEIDFVTDEGLQTVPIEVKHGKGHSKSLSVYKEKHCPQRVLIVSAREYFNKKVQLTWIYLFMPSVTLENI